MKSISATTGKGNFRIAGIAISCGKDVNFSFTGGTHPHIGAVALAVYEPERDSATVSTISVYTHRDDQLAHRCAKEAATALKCVVSVSVGIHIDHAAQSDIEILGENCNACCQMLIKKLQNAAH